jgi:hypothetical protein
LAVLSAPDNRAIFGGSGLALSLALVPGAAMKMAASGLWWQFEIALICAKL